MVDRTRSVPSAGDCYDLPCGMSFIRSCQLFKFIPFCPTFLVDIKQGQHAANHLNDDISDGEAVASDAAEMSPVNAQSPA